MKKEKLLLILLCISLWCSAQDRTEKQPKTNYPAPRNTLYQFGHAEAFINGVYQGILPAGELHRHGDFGLGAPAQVDGELTMDRGKLYQTTADGKTKLVKDELKIPFAFVTTLSSPKVTRLHSSGNLQALYQNLQGLLNGRNSMYAIRISGNFSSITTHTFPPFKKGDSTPLAKRMDAQRTFAYHNSSGTLIGFYLPAYLAGTNIAGFHFHFLSSDFSQGGHLVSLDHQGMLQVEISQIDDFLLELPKSGDFLDFQFSGENKADLQKVEKGNK